MVDGRRYAAGVSGASSAAAVCVLPAAVCAGDEPGDRSAARGDAWFRCTRGLGLGRTCWIRTQPLPGISLKSPFLSLGQVAALRAREYPHADELRLEELRCVCAGADAGRGAGCAVRVRRSSWCASGARMLLMTDRAASAEALADPDGDGDGRGAPGAGGRPGCAR